MRVGELRGVLQQSGALGVVGGEPTPAELADALWLAALRRAGCFAPLAVEDQLSLEEPRDEAGDPGAEWPTRQGRPARPPLPPAPGSGSAAGAQVYANLAMRGGPSPAMLVSAATRPQLPDALLLARAMRPLRRRVLSATRRVLDEDKTADLRAEQRLWLPALVPDSELAFDLALVVDTSESMALWSEKVREFRLLCERIGAFRDVRLWRLEAGSGGQDRPALRGLSQSGGARDERELIDLSGRRLILVVTDGVHPWWRPSGLLRPILARWALASPLAIVQPFPQRLWDRSPLHVMTETFRPGWPGNGPTIRRPGTGHVDGQDNLVSVTVPVLELSPAAMSRWAEVISGNIGLTSLPAVTLPWKSKAEQEPTEPSPADRGESHPDPARLVRDFRASVSPAAYQLAGYLSAAPLTLPVMRLVQESMMPETGPAELAEVFLSGLLRRSDTSPPKEAESTLYTFAAGVRDVLQSTLTKGEALSILDRVGRYLVRGRNGGRAFPVALETQPAGDDIAVAAARFPASFGRISGQLLERIGRSSGHSPRQAAPALGGRGPGMNPSSPAQLDVPTIMRIGPARMTAGLDRMIRLDLQAHTDVFGPLPRMSALDLIDMATQVDLRGQGGAAFPFARKLKAVIDASKQTSDPAIVVVNCAETEPGSFKDKMLMIRSPYLVLSGAALVCEALQAEGIIIGVTGNELATRSIEAAIAAESGLRKMVSVVQQPERFVSGESGALVRGINGKKPVPPSPKQLAAEKGVGGLPTLLSNASTFAQVAVLALLGPERFASVGVPEEPGTTLLSVSGSAKRPAVVECPTGVPLGAVLDICQAPAGDGVLVGGYHGMWLDAETAYQVPVGREGLASAGGTFGPGIVLPLGDGTCPLGEVSRIATYLAGESAGQCGPCKLGLPSIARALAAIVDGSGGIEALDVARRAAVTVNGRGACSHPDGTTRFVLTALDVFAEDLAAHAFHSTCGRPVRGMLPLPEGPERENDKQLTVDWARCEGHGLCAHLVPELIHLDREGFPVILKIAVPPWLEQDAQQAVQMCPTLALRLSDAPSPRSTDHIAVPDPGPVRNRGDHHPIRTTLLSVS